VIKAGWKRELCPQCRQPGRVGDRVQTAIRARKPDGKSLFVDPSKTSFVLLKFIGPRELGFSLNADVCDNCGVLYAYEAVALPDPNPERKTDGDRTGEAATPKPTVQYTSATSCGFCRAGEGHEHHPSCQWRYSNLSTTGPTGPQRVPAERAT